MSCFGRPFLREALPHVGFPCFVAARAAAAAVPGSEPKTLVRAGRGVSWELIKAAALCFFGSLSFARRSDSVTEWLR